MADLVVHIKTKQGGRICQNHGGKRGKVPLHRGVKDYMAEPPNLRCPTCMKLLREKKK